MASELLGIIVPSESVSGDAVGALTKFVPVETQVPQAPATDGYFRPSRTGTYRPNSAQKACGEESGQNSGRPRCAGKLFLEPPRVGQRQRPFGCLGYL